MDSNISELVKSGHEIASDLKASCGAVDVRSVAQLISDLSSQLEVQYVRAEESQREFRSADITMQNLEAKCEKLAAENAGLKAFGDQLYSMYKGLETSGGGFHDEQSITYQQAALDAAMSAFEEIKTPATDAFLAEVRDKARKEGAYFVANRMLAAWDAGFIDDTAKNAADIARMILTSTEFMADAPEGDFDRSFADGVLEDIASQLRKGGAQ
ncbi:hypothetical protein H2359_000759 [Salmonella enterica]|nr:hypothetical protein [Salmonella enterica]ECK0357247.1 hypothetical protein [Salmonella enterica subsp. enterica serovar Urbana]EAZ5519639.1 hypothetical protein [Salmonella enterica]EBA5587960.1 hypothetical protein [Salmonella enterica]EBB1668973.1 hypothetical protein [Salmonella enterica]